MNAAVIYHTPSRLCEELASPFATAEAAIRRASANVGIGLLRILGASETGRVVECVDRVRDRLSLQRQANPNEIQMTAIHEAHWWVQEHYQVRIVSPLEREDPDHRLAALLWATHSALPPSISHALTLRLLFSLSTGETAAVLGVASSNVSPLVNRAARRMQAFGLNLKPTSATGTRFGFKMAEQRLRTLERTSQRLGAESYLSQSLAQWLVFLRSFRRRRAA